MQNLTKCHFNRPGKARRRSVKGMLPFVLLNFDFWTILVHVRFDDSFHFVHVIDTHYVWVTCGWTYVVRTIFSAPKFLGCIDNEIFLPMVHRYEFTMCRYQNVSNAESFSCKIHCSWDRKCFNSQYIYLSCRPAVESSMSFQWNGSTE